MKPRGRERHRWATRTGELSGESESIEPWERARWTVKSVWATDEHTDKNLAPFQAGRT